MASPNAILIPESLILTNRLYCRFAMEPTTDLMHPRSVFRTKPNFAHLAEKYPEFKQFCSLNIKNKLTYDFKNREAMKILSQTLLLHYFGLKTNIPSSRLVPTVPLRLNYILWIEDLISLLPLQSCSGNREVRGIDIGCGSCAIYMLLGAKVNSWEFLGLCLESDYENVHSSLENINMNDLNDKIQVQRVENGYALSDVLDPQSEWTFCLTNPPFYDTDVSSEAGSQSECSTPGGETSVINTLIDHSLIVNTRVKWFTALVGIKKNLAPLKQRLSETESVKRIETTEFRQGKTWRWGLAWTFCENVNAPLPNYAKISKATKNQHKSKNVSKPIEWSIALTEFSNLMSFEKDLEKFSCISEFAHKLLMDVKDANIETVSDIPCCLKLKFVARKVTWIHSRRQRRAEKKTPEKMESNIVDDQINAATTKSFSDKLEIGLLKRSHETETLTANCDGNDDSGKQPLSKVPKLSHLSSDIDNDVDSGINCDVSGYDIVKLSNINLTPQNQVTSPSISESSLVSIRKEEVTDNANDQDTDEDVLSCSIVFKLSKQNFVMTFSSADANQKENLNSLMLYVKGAINRYKAQND